jgi:hypothetical protein
MVSLNFLVDNDGDGYPFSTETSNPVDLDSTNINHTQQATFAELGSEQNALAEYLLEFYTVNPFSMEETDVTLDERIQILSVRNDSVLNGRPSIGLVENNIGNAISLYPNPATNQITITSSQAALDQITIMNMQGAVVMQINGDTSMQFDLDVSSLPAGHYLINVKTVQNQTIHRMVITK